MRFARWSFGIAAGYGLVATLSLYGRAPLALEHIWLFVFAGAAAATQLLYVALAIDPVRYRPLIPIGIASKLSFAGPVGLLWLRGAAPGGLALAALIDLALAGVFALNWWRLRGFAQSATSASSRTPA